MDDKFDVGGLIWRRSGIYTQPARVTSLTPSGFRSERLSGGEPRNHRYTAHGIVNGVHRLNAEEIERVKLIEECRKLRFLDVDFDPHTFKVSACSVKYTGREVDADTVWRLIDELRAAAALLGWGEPKDGAPKTEEG